MSLTGFNFIGSETSEGTGRTFTSYNPVTGQAIKQLFYSASREDVNNAVAQALSAFKTYRSTSGVAKAKFLEAIADEIMELGDQLIDVATRETGLAQTRLVGERGRTVNQLKMFAGLVREGSWVEASIDTAIPDREPIPKPDLRRTLISLGPIVVFGASNFPLAFSTAGGDTASALAGGNPVIVKAHNSHPGTSELVAGAIRKAVEKCGLHPGVFSHLQDHGIEVGGWLVKHPNVKGVGFTGSFAGGKALYDLAQKREVPIPVFAEMGSVNPVILFPDALNQQKEQISSSYAESITLGVGQFCTNPGLIMGIESDNLSTFTKLLGNEISRSQPASMLNEGVFRNYNRSTDEIIEQREVMTVGQAHLRVDFGGQAGQKNDIKNAGIPIIASVDADDFLKNDKLREEVFGPYSLIVKCKDISQLKSTINSLAGQLTITIMCTESDLVQYGDLVDDIREKAGRVIFNGVPTGVEVCASMQHGGPFPATTDPRFTSVGTAAIKRFVRPVTYQDCPNAQLPDELKNENPLGIWRLVNNSYTQEGV